MELRLEDIAGWVGDFLWPFLRFGALFLAAPVFGARSVPLRIRITLTLVVTLLVQPTLSSLEPIDPFSLSGMLMVLQQLLIGILIGLTLQILFGSLVMAGQIIATTMGLGFASSVDPQNGVQVTMLGQLYLLVATLVFLVVDGHLLMIKVLADSFVAIPVSTELLPAQVLMDFVAFSAQLFQFAVLVSLPIMSGVLLVNVGFGVMARAAPQLNLFAVGFPTTILSGFVLMFLCLPAAIPILRDLFSLGFDFLRLMVN